MIELVKIGYREFKRFILGKDKFISVVARRNIEGIRVGIERMYIVQYNSTINIEIMKDETVIIISIS